VLLGHPSYPPNPPVRTFADELTLRVGGHTFHCLHLPGHTGPQTAVHVPEEGVVFTGDNVFCRSKTFIQEADPWDWLAALRRIERLDVEVIVPGHGEPCDRGYVAEQAEILERWLGAVQRMVDRGLTEEEAVREPLDMAAIDPYPLGQRLFATFPHLDELNVRNLYGRVVAVRGRSWGQATSSTDAGRRTGDRRSLRLQRRRQGVQRAHQGGTLVVGHPEQRARDARLAAAREAVHQLQTARGELQPVDAPVALVLDRSIQPCCASRSQTGTTAAGDTPARSRAGDR